MDKLLTLKCSTIESFYIYDIETHDLLFRFEFGLFTNKGVFRSTVEFDDHLLENMTVMFRPEFGNILKNKLIDLIDDAITNGYEDDIIVEFSKSK